jgi:2,3-bisphosphoglycerate-dependent phosphoglycerate mutase
MKRKIYFVRHSIRDLSIHDDENAPLTNKGHELAYALADYFADKEITAIYSSPYKRTHQTVQPLSNLKHLPIHLENNLRERKIGRWIEDFDAFVENQWRDWDFKLENGESLNQVKNRMVPIVNSFLKETKGDIVLSSHGTALAVLFSYLTETFSMEDFKEMTMPDVYVGEFDGTLLTDFYREETE